MGLFAETRTDVKVDRLTVHEVHTSVATMAAVNDHGRIQIIGADPAHAGAEYWLGIDLPGLAVPDLRSGMDLGPALLVTPRGAPFGLGRYVHNRILGFHGTIGPDGGFTARMEWENPDLLHNLSFRVAGWVVDPNGERILGQLPTVWVH